MWTLALPLLALFLSGFSEAAILGEGNQVEDFCASSPCGDGNTCFNTPTGYKCFCRPGYDSYDCVKEEECMLYNHTGVCRNECLDDETGFFISHLGGKFMDLRVYNKDGNVTVQQQVPVVDIKEQVPCMWQLTGKPNCCVPTKDTKIGCFVYGSMVRTENRGVVRIEDVKTGDKVLSFTEDGTPTYSDVIMIMHQEPERVENMVTIETEDNKKQTLTHDHLLLMSYDGNSWNYQFSERATPGAHVKTLSSDGDVIINRITAVTRSNQQGLYAPVTLTGNIVVDDIAASCYGNHPDHDLSHMVFAPIRALYRLLPGSYDGDAVAADGSHPYVSFLNRYMRQLTGYSLVLSQHRLDHMTTYL